MCWNFLTALGSAVRFYCSKSLGPYFCSRNCSGVAVSFSHTGLVSFSVVIPDRSPAPCVSTDAFGFPGLLRLSRFFWLSRALYISADFFGLSRAPCVSSNFRVSGLLASQQILSAFQGSLFILEELPSSIP